MTPTALEILQSYLATLAALMGLGVAILLAGIPWALKIEGRLARIECAMAPPNSAAPAEPHRWAVYRLRSGASRRWYQFATWHIVSIFDGSDRA